jgi:thymidylate synthase
MVNNGENGNNGDDKTFKNGDRYPVVNLCMILEKNMLTRLKVLIDTLRTNPDSRRMIVNAWNV